jgi:tetratricopeptide (TPR) repeat protein
MGRIDRSLRDRFTGTLNQARFLKMSKHHDLAIRHVDEVLSADPNFPEALFVKALILWEGYQDAAAAKQYLLKAIKAELDKNATFHRWALSLYREIAIYERTQNEFCPSVKKLDTD